MSAGLVVRVGCSRPKRLLESSGTGSQHVRLPAGRAVAYQVIFGALHAHAIETASSGLLRTLEEACAAAEDRTPSSIKWRES